VHTHALGRELGDQRGPLSVPDLAQCINGHRFGEAAGGRLSEKQLIDAIKDIELGALLPFDDTLLKSFNVFAARCLSGGNGTREQLILDKLALAAALDILRELGISLPPI
jgi:hypothetical protein